MNKAELRKLVRKRIAATGAEALGLMSLSACNSVLETREWKEAKVVLLYMSMKDETNTRILVKEAWEEGKTVLLPTCVGEDLVLRVYEGEGRMRTGDFGIMEPVGMIYDEGEYRNIDLAIVPGMAFDRLGGRLGRGRGFYDRLLPKLCNCHKIGLCWEVQIVECVPMEEDDVAMDCVIYK